MTQPDAVLVLGGGVRESGELPSWVVRRFDRALELAGQAPIVCLSAGTVHRAPPLNAHGFPWLESVAGAAHLMRLGVPGDRIQVESISYDTIGNAYFAKLIHVDPAGWTKLIVITSEFHMPRSRETFEWIFGLSERRYDLQFEATADEGLEVPLLERRRSRETQRLESLRALKQRISNLHGLHRWMFNEHQAYTAEGWVSRTASDLATQEIY